MKSLQDVAVGDTVVRVIAGLKVSLRVSAVSEGLIYCGGWAFERDSGVEYDPELCWGTKYGVSGSYIEVSHEEK